MSMVKEFKELASKGRSEFLQQVPGFDDREYRKLVEKLAQVQRDERCVHRIVIRMAGFTALVLVGLGYGLVLETNFAASDSNLLVRLIWDIALASLFSLAGIVGLWLVYRSRLNRLLSDGYRLFRQLLEDTWRLSSDGIPVAEEGNGKTNGSAMVATLTSKECKT